MTDPNDTLPDDYAFARDMMLMLGSAALIATAAVLQGLGIIDLCVWQFLYAV